MRPELDLRGRYLFDGLLAGEYELSVDDRITVAGAPPILIERVAQKITVANGAETEITLVLKRRDK